jgi:uncharacterized membrane protein YkoI
VKRYQIISALIAGISLTATTGAAFAYSGQDLAKNAKITMEEARATALAVQPGTVADAELEQEDGGSGLRYSFDIKPAPGGATHEVGVDASTGKILENSVEGANPD